MKTNPPNSISCPVSDIDGIGLYRNGPSESRALHEVFREVDLVVVGGGLPGTCASLAAAREGLRVVLIQDRPVLGGNGSSEVRLWMLGATSHMGNNNRWARESGIVGEILVENLYRNPEGNPLILDSLLLEKVCQEPNIELLLNTAVYEISKDSPCRLESLHAFCSQNSTQYTVRAKVFMDCSGDGIISFLAGSPFRMGAETVEEFGEKLAPTREYGHLLGHSVYFYSKDVGKPVKYVKPAFATVDVEKILPYRSFDLKDQGCKFWWIEYGGRRDTVHDTEEIKWELWKVVYGIWDYIKNSGKFPESETHTLEWVGTIPGKRESRRFEGFNMLKQQDIVEQREHEDAVAYGGWALDLHPADGVYAKTPACNQYHSKGVYQIPLSVALSPDIENLAFGGRIISASHVAFGSIRVMLTLGYLAQATGIAVAHAIQKGIPLRELVGKNNIPEVQRRIQRQGQHIPRVPFDDPDDLIRRSTIRASSCHALTGFPADGPGENLDVSAAMLLPVKKGRFPAFRQVLEAVKSTRLILQLRISEKAGNFTPDIILKELILPVREGQQVVDVDFGVELEREGYVFITCLSNPLIRLANSESRLSGVLSVYNGEHKAVSNRGTQITDTDVGVDSFEFWIPQRRPEGRNFALSFLEPTFTFDEAQLVTGFERPTGIPNVWIADPDDPSPSLTFDWQEPQKIKRVIVSLDTDFDHPMESVLWGHPEAVIPFCVRDLDLLDENGQVLASVKENYRAKVTFHLKELIETRRLELRLKHPSARIPAAVFAVNCYES